MTTKQLRNTLPAVLSKEFFRQIEDFVEDGKLNSKPTYPYNFIEVYDDDGRQIEARIEYALAGIPKDSISIKVVDDELQIDAVKVDRAVKPNEHYAHQGISYRVLNERIKLSPMVDCANITSTFKDGILILELPIKQPEIKSVDIKIA
jgi:HSP20 family molecular chaperone IbpA